MERPCVVVEVFRLLYIKPKPHPSLFKLLASFPTNLDSMPRRKIAHIDSDDNAETIDITNISDTSSLVREPAQTPSVTPSANTPGAPAAGLLAPLLPSAPTSHTNRAHDIDYFFKRGLKTEGTSTICKPCW